MGMFGPVVALALHLLFAFGVFCMCRRAGVARAWLAWIPIASLFLYGRLVGRLCLHILLPVLSGALVALAIGYHAASGVTLLTAMPPLFFALLCVSIAFYFFLQLNNFFVYRARTPQYVICFCFSVLLIFLTPVFVFALRNKRMIDRTN